MFGSGDLGAFRAEVRSWLADHVPDGWREKIALATIDEYVAFQHWWLSELLAGGYAVAHWPAEYGGGAGLAEQVVIFEEMAAAQAPELRIFMVSLNHAAKTLMVHGTDDQKKHLDAIKQGEVWCQGFSEPNAGSDLASLQTRAERHGDVYVVNGQKIWSSVANFADWCLLLTRTDPEAPKRDGITYLLLDLRSPGVDIRPIRQSTGDMEFCELFLTDVEIPVANRVGEENGGWAIAHTTLSAERGPVVLELQERLKDALVQLFGTAAAEGLTSEGDVRQTLARHYAEVEVLRLLCTRMLSQLMRDGEAGPESSIIKLYYSELLQRLTDTGVQLSGPRAQLARQRSAGEGYISGDWLIDHVGSWAWTIAGGSSQIQRNLIGERVLGLPREPAAS